MYVFFWGEVYFVIGLTGNLSAKHFYNQGRTTRILGGEGWGWTPHPPLPYKNSYRGEKFCTDILPSPFRCFLMVHPFYIVH